MGLAFVVFCGGINKPKKPVNHALAVSGGELALVEVIVHPQPRTCLLYTSDAADE